MIEDLAAKILRPAEIAEKHGITIGNVYTIRSGARKAGIINSRGYKSIGERVKDESTVFTPGLREHIKDLREKDLTSTEISALLTGQGIEAPLEKVQMVMARGASDFIGTKMGKKWGISP